MIFEQQDQYLTKDKVKSDGFKRRLSFFFLLFFFKLTNKNKNCNVHEDRNSSKIYRKR